MPLPEAESPRGKMMYNNTRNLRSRLGPRPGDFPLGSLESRAAARAVQLARDLEIQEQQAALLENLTPLERAFLEGVSDPVKPSPALHMLLNKMIKMEEQFGLPLPTPEEVRHWRQVEKEIAKVEQERKALGDTSFLDKKTLRKMAEDRLRGERRGGTQSGATTAPNGAAVN